jgi:molybdenum cofactor synthesis domain-containing protein
MPNPTAAMLVIGDEILSGRTRDSNAHHLAGRLAVHGIDLKEIRVVGDAAGAITRAARKLSDRHDHLFTSGGIGPTHDDITADCIAAVTGADIDVREDARAILAAHYAARRTDLNAARLRMARIPEGARLIENPVSAAPGFSLGNIHVMAGVPQIFEAMLEGLLPRLTGGTALEARTLRLDRPEGDLAGPLRELAEAFPELSIGSYPSWSGTRHELSVVLRGRDAVAIGAAAERLREAFPEAWE